MTAPNTLNVDTFWSWAVAQWTDPVVATEMMALQEEHGCTVLELLLMGWLGLQGWAVTPEARHALATTAAPWLDGVVIPLRSTRRGWRENDGLASQRQQLQRLELKAEYALAELYFGSLAVLGPSELVLMEESRVIDNLGIALSVAAKPVPRQRIVGLGALLS
ncbi:TIGR02444 family protein [Luminiphilus sp. nBUS_07]|uniref:TIGR02444 family protein n=1 Tax=Luminiphilus sp. nBUS_07 TaxID=3395314 RepID=UPI003EBC6BE6